MRGKLLFEMFVSKSSPYIYIIILLLLNEYNIANPWGYYNVVVVCDNDGAYI